MILPKERRSYSHTLGRCISGGSAVTDDDLRQQIRARLSEGRLPAVNGVSNRAGEGGVLGLVGGRA